MFDFFRKGRRPAPEPARQAELGPPASDPWASLASLCAPVDPRALCRLLARAGFTPAGYRAANADLVAALPADDAASLRHFLEHGIHEAREFPVELQWDVLEEIRALPFEHANTGRQLTRSLISAYFWPNRLAQATAKQALSKIRDYGGRPFLLIGDSHSMSYRRPAWRGDAWLLPLHVNCIAGSARGLSNPASRSGYGRRIRELWLEMANLEDAPGVPVLWKFGQVDTEFVHTFRRVSKNLVAFDVAEFAQFSQRSVEGYAEFLASVVPASLRRESHVCSIFAPALSDEAHAQGYVSGHITSLESDLDAEAMLTAVRKLEIPDLATRTRMHRTYNALLAEQVRPLGFEFLDDFSALLGNDGTLDERFRQHAGGFDHHVNFQASASVLEPILWDILTPRTLAQPSNLDKG
ncbi:MAG: hypothetical protein QM778_37180 [Myxococcales bacterium]